MSIDYGNKFSKFVESLETQELVNITIGNTAIAFDPESGEYETVRYSDNNSCIVAAGNVSGASGYHELWTKIFGTDEYDQSDLLHGLTEEQMSVVANFQREIMAQFDVTEEVDAINERYLFEMEEAEQSEDFCT